MQTCLRLSFHFAPIDTPQLPLALAQSNGFDACEILPPDLKRCYVPRLPSGIWQRMHRPYSSPQMVATNDNICPSKKATMDK